MRTPWCGSRYPFMQRDMSDGNLGEIVGAMIRSARRARRLSQEELAAMIDLSPVSLSNIERGAVVPTLPVFLRLAESLSLTGQQLQTLISDEKPSTSRERLRTEAEIYERIRKLSSDRLTLANELLKALEK